MNKPNLLTGELFQILEKKLASQEIYLQIEDQDCYLIQSGTKQCMKIKIGDLSLTKEYYCDQWTADLFKYLAKHQAQEEEHE